MGCDIHTVMQVFVDGQWKTVAKEVCDNRHYLRFAVLCGMSADRLPFEEPIAEFRGLPKDFEYETRDNHEFEDRYHAFDGDTAYLGYCGFSFVTLQEMLDYDKRQLLSGLVTPAQYAEWNHETEPDDWSTYPDPGDVVKEESEYLLRQKLGILQDEDVLIKVWFRADTGLDSLMDALASRAPGEDPRDVRLVFGFDV